MANIAVLADDLTGASDSGVQFARKGLSTRVVFDLERCTPDMDLPETVVIDTDSRTLEPAEAYRLVYRASMRLKQWGNFHIYKKIDSTLRGHLGTEIDAVLDAQSFDFAVVAPAFPKMGRTTVGGFHLLHGVPVHKTEMGRDPKCPVRESDLRVLLASQSKRQIGWIPLNIVRAGQGSVIREVERLLESGSQVIVFDAETEEDLRRITGLVHSDRRILWVGSAGLADPLPVALGLAVREPPSLAISQTNRPILLVAGSTSHVTREQVAIFRSQPDVVSVELDPLRVLEHDDREREILRCRHELLTAADRGYDVVFYAGSSPEQVAGVQRLGATLGMTAVEISNRIAETLGQVAAEVVADREWQGLILTGGDTAKAVCKRLGVSGMQLFRELEPGVPIGRLIGENPLWVVTKAGAFGQADTLVHARSVLKGGIGR